MADKDVKKAGRKSIKNMINDGWENVLTGLGRLDRDKRMSTQFGVADFVEQGTLLDQLYTNDWLISRACDRPASEQTREWIDIKTEEDIETAKAVLSAANDLGAKSAMNTAIAWGRLHGAGLVLMGIEDGQEPVEKVDEDRIRSVDWLQVIDRWDVSVVSRFGTGPKVGQPEMVRLHTTVPGADTLDGVKLSEPIHASRFLLVEGTRISLRERNRNEGWAHGIIPRLYSVIRDFHNAIGGAAHLTTDFAQATLKIQGLAAMLSEDANGGNETVIKRLQLLDMARSVARIVPLDAESEEFERKATPITGLPDLIDRFVEHLAGALDMPAKVLFGKATPGLGDQGNSDLAQWREQMKGEQERNLLPQMTQLLRYIWLSKQGPSKGVMPETWSVKANPLEQLSQGQEATMRKTQAEADAVYIGQGVVMPEEVRSSRFGGDEFSLETTLDPEISEALKDVDKTEPEPPPGPEIPPEPEPLPPEPAPEPEPEE